MRIMEKLCTAFYKRFHNSRPQSDHVAMDETRLSWPTTAHEAASTHVGTTFRLLSAEHCGLMDQHKSFSSSMCHMHPAKSTCF